MSQKAIGLGSSMPPQRRDKMRSITIDELRNKVESYIEAAKSASGDSAVRFLKIEDLKEDLK